MIRASKPKIKGFTLVELMIVMAIVAILGAVAAPLYSGYIVKAKMTEVVGAFASVRALVESETQMRKTMPQSILGIPFNSAEVVSGRETDIIEGFRYGGNTSADQYWFVARVKDGVLPGGSLSSRKREVHYGIVKTASGDWEFYCGAWSSAFIDTDYLPSGCEEAAVGTALGSAWN